MDAAGAEAFARYWFTVSDYAYQTGDVEQIDAIAEGTCTACQRISEEIKSQFASGGHFEGMVTTVESAAATPPDERGTIVTVVYREAANRTIAADGTVEEEFAASGTAGANVYLSATPQGWRVFGISRVE